MALADIIRRIESDAAAEAERIEREARERADAMLAEARSTAKTESELALERARRAAVAQAGTLVSGVRLASRDAGLVARRELIEEGLASVVAQLESLPAEDYARLLATRIAAIARGGETVRLAAADAVHRDAISAAVSAARPDIALTWSDEPADLARGAEVSSDRIRTEISPDAVVDDARDQLELALASALFAEGEA